MDTDKIEVFTTLSKRGNVVACMHVRAPTNAKFTLLFSHGNASDLGEMVRLFVRISEEVCCNIFAYDYSGYGMSSGRPSEKNMYADAEAAFHALKSRYRVEQENVILYGFSIGTVATVHLATLYRAAAVVLHAPLMSGIRVLFPDAR